MVTAGQETFRKWFCFKDTMKQGPPVKDPPVHFYPVKEIPSFKGGSPGRTIIAGRAYSSRMGPSGFLVPRHRFFMVLDHEKPGLLEKPETFPTCLFQGVLETESFPEDRI